MKQRIIMVMLLIICLIPRVSFGGNKIIREGMGQQGKTGVTVIDQGNYFKVSLDYTSGLTHRQIGEALGTAILKAVPDYEALIDSYISQSITNYEYPDITFRVADLKINLEQEYADEIEGMASKFSGGTKNVRGDRQISQDEFYMFNLFPDVARGSQCNFISVFGRRSATGKTLLTRTLDWYGGDHNELPRVQAVIIFKYPDTQICSIGYLGYQGILTAFNDRKVFAAILDSSTGAPYSAIGKRSYPLDLRFALEHKTTLGDVAAFMLDPHNNYTVNHIIALAAPTESKILENNFSGQGATRQQVRRALRSSDSRLNRGVTWGITDAIGSVNSFLLWGNYDNHTPNQFNTKRWKNIKRELTAKGTVVTLDELKAVAAYNHGSPGTFTDSGDLYNKTTLHMVVFQPDTLSMQVFFHSRHTRQSPKKPVFENVKVF
jgi:hypothetical protein